MSKVIKITKESIEKCVEEFRAVIESGKFPDGKINYTKNLGLDDRKANIYFTEDAWVKMQALVMTSKKEIGWHGIAKRGEEPYTYVISDILVYPQEVTGCTVNTNQSEYEMWLMNHDDEVFNNIRMQGHSHVDFSVSPSSVDLNLYERILDQLGDDMFYIFLIYNKRGEKTIKIYDLKENLLFETSDVTVSVVKKQNGIMDFLKESMELVVENKTSSYKPQTTYSGYTGGYGSTYSSGVKSSNSSSEQKKDDKSSSRKGKRTGTRATTDREYGYNSGYYDCGYNRYYDDWTDEYYENKYGIK